MCIVFNYISLLAIWYRYSQCPAWTSYCHKL